MSLRKSCPTIIQESTGLEAYEEFTIKDAVCRSVFYLNTAGGMFSNEFGATGSYLLAHILTNPKDIVRVRQPDGCEYCCVNDWERKTLATWTTYFDNWIEEKHELYISDYKGEYFISPDATEGPRFDIRCCPMCGRKLEVEG